MAMSDVGPCQQRVRLMNDYHELLRIYADLIRESLDLMTHGFESEVKLLRQRCWTTWEATERARIAIYRHEADHDCTSTLGRGRRPRTVRG